MSDFKRGQAVAWTDPDTNKTLIGRVLGLTKVNRESGESYQETYEGAGSPYDVAVRDGQRARHIVARVDELAPLGSSIDDPIDIDEFGDTPASATSWLARLVARVTRELGDNGKTTVTPRCWVVIDCVETVLTQEGYYCDYHLFSFNDSPEPYRALQALEHIARNLADDPERLEAFSRYLQHTYRNMVHDPRAELRFDVQDDELITTYVDDSGTHTYNLCRLTASNAEGTVTIDNTTLDALVCRICNDDRLSRDENEDGLLFRLGFSGVVAMHEVEGMFTNRAFSTLEDCQQWIERNRHFLTPKARPYPVRLSADPTASRLWRILQQVDWSRSTLVMSTPIMDHAV